MRRMNSSGALVCSTYPKSLTDARINQLYPELSQVRSEIVGQWRTARSKGVILQVEYGRTHIATTAVRV